MIPVPYPLQLVPVTRTFERWINKLRMGWLIRPGQYYVDLDIVRSIRKKFHLVDWTPVTRLWVEQDLSEVPDSGIGHPQDHRTDLNNEVWCEPDTYQPTSSQPIRRKRRAGDRLETRSNVDRRVRREGNRWGTPRKRALFGPDGPDSMSSGRGPASSSQTTRGSGFTSMSGPRYSGTSSWDQYQQVFEAIVCSN